MTMTETSESAERGVVAGVDARDVGEPHYGVCEARAYRYPQDLC